MPAAYWLRWRRRWSSITFFTAPYWSLSVDDPSYWITFVIMTITAFITSALTSKAKLNAQNALQREQEIKTMYALSRRLNEEIDIRQIAAWLRGTCRRFACRGPLPVSG